MADLSIAIVTYNDRELLEKCLESIYKNTRKLNFEIFVVDNASTDGTAGMLQEKFKEVNLIINKENLGFIKATNQVLRRVKTKYVLLLNSDTVVLEGALEKMVQFMEEYSEAGAVGPKLLNPDKSIQKIGRKFLNFNFQDPHSRHKVSWICGACLMVRDKIIEEVGLLDENLYFYNDDLDWCRRMRKKGWELWYLPEAEVIHYGGVASKQLKKELLLAGYRGSYYYCQKHYGKFIATIYKGLATLELVVRLIIYALFGKRKDLKVYWYVFKGYLKI
jgi:GT2 family glycosyltransferase